MLCSAADWDLRVIMSYLNTSEESYKADINYLFYPINQSRFIRFNKQFIRAGCRAFRISTSPEPTLPCKPNKDVYNEILGLNTSKKSDKKGFFKKLHQKK
jgi:endonuclease YncB( thermonuclease family)